MAAKGLDAFVGTHRLETSRKTQAFAGKMGRVLAAGTVLKLHGDLGAGKTTFVQGLARGLGVENLREVVSPTYTLVNEYVGGRLPLVHIDFYRLKDAESALALGLEEQLARHDAVIAVEWAEMFPALFSPGAVDIRLFVDEGGRRIEIGGG